jgi:YVTN family beta-propeller protein
MKSTSPIVAALGTLIFLAISACCDELSAAEPPPSGAQALAVACKWADSIVFYDVATGQEQQLVPIGHRPHEMALAKDGGLAFVTLYGTDFYYDAVEGGRAIAILDLANRRKLGEIDLGQYRRPHGIEVGHRTGRLYVTCDRPAALLILDPERRSVEASIPLANPQALPHMVAISRDERAAYVANCGDATISIIDLETRKEIKGVPIGGVPMGMALTADGRRLFATNRTADGVAVIDTAAAKVTRIIEIRGQPVRACLTPDERQLLVTLIDAGELAVVDVRELGVSRRLAIGQRVEGMLIDPEGRFGYASAQADNKVVKFSLSDWRPVLEIKTAERPDPLLLTPDVPTAKCP